MNKVTILVFSIILLLAGLLTAQDVESQLSLQYNSKIEYMREVYNRILQMIRENPEAGELDKLYFNLAELSTELDRNNPTKTASFYKQIIQYNRDFAYKDIVLYNIGYYSYQAAVLQNGQARQKTQNYQNIPDSLKYSEDVFSESIRYYKRLLEEFPQSSYYSETAWRLADIYYMIGDETRKRIAFLRAIDYYNLAIQQTGSSFYFPALAGKAETLFILQEKSDAIALEFSILNQLDSIPDLRNRELLATEAINNLAWSFAKDNELDFENSSVTAARLEIRLAGLHNPENQKRVMISVADQLLLDDRPQTAIGLYETFQELFPLSANAPQVAASKIAIYQKYPDIFGGEENCVAQIKAIQADIRRNFNPNSNWYQENSGKDILPAIDVIRSAIEFGEPLIFNDFLTEPDKNNYLRYRLLVNDYSGFQQFDTPQSLQKLQTYRQNLVYMSQMLAQATNKADDYFYALRDLREYNDFYPQHQQLVNFEKNIFFCYEKLYNISQTDTLRLPDNDLANMDSLYIIASNKYEQILRADEEWETHQNELARVIFKRAEFLSQQERYEEAVSDFLAVTELDAENELISDAFRRAAEIALQKQDYDNAEAYLRQAMDFSSGYSQSDVYKNVILVIRQKAENLLLQQEYSQAAAEFLRLSLELEAIYPEQSLSYLNRAIDVYEDLGNDNKVNELLNVVAVRQNMNQIVAVYRNIWQEADKLEDYTRSLSLREDFIDRYPGTNEAWRVKLQIIDIYENKLHEKARAAEMYLQLHAEYQSYDLGRERPESIFLNALRIYQDLDDKAKCAQLSETFTEMYPDYSLIDLNLTYSDTDNFRTSIRKLKKLKENINSLFQQQEYEIARQNIEEFRQIATALNVDSLRIDLSEDNLLFNNYLSYADYYKNLKLEVSKIENGFLLQKPQQLIPVSSDTRWQENMVGGENLIGMLLQKCNDYRNNLLGILQDGAAHQLDTPGYTHAIWAIAAAYDHGYEAVDQQIKNFVVKSAQLNRPELENNDYLRSELKRRLIAEGKEYSFEFQLAAADFYQNLLYQFYDNASYNDLWTRKALNRLNEWGIRDASGALVMLDEKMMFDEESYANEEIEKEYNQIFAEYQNRQYSSAQVKFMNFLTSYPGHSLSYEALYFAAECYYNMGQLSKAMEMLEKVIDFEREKTPDALLRLGHCYNSIGKKQEAYACWNRLIEEYPDNYLTDVIKLTFVDIAKQEESAQAAASIPARTEQKVTLKYRNYIQSYKLGKYKAARKGFASITRKYPEHPLAYSALFMQAESYYQEENYAEAAAIYSQVAAQSGNKTVNSIYKLGQCAEKTGNLALRDRYWQQIVDDYPEHYLANVVMGGEEAVKTQRTIERPAAAKPRQVPATPVTSSPANYQYKKALMDFRYNKYAEAATGFREFATQYPEHRLAFNARYLLAESYQKLEQYQDALTLYQELLPESGARRSENLLHIAQIYLALGDTQSASTILQEIKINYAGTFNAAQANKMLNQLTGADQNEE
ncbi:MAG: tetratricopeptide repeat protein [Candidatus Cloacimonetes bacterium]|nr:tetratricopeptide repeat protein [Candidatus Cloacimonadota bacterium]